MSKGKRGDALGTFECVACGCCSGPREFTVYSDLTMLCESCGCYQDREDVNLNIRLYVTGRLTLAAMKQMQEVATLLGGQDDTLMVRENDLSYYMEIPTEGVQARLEIAKITRGE